MEYELYLEVIESSGKFKKKLFTDESSYCSTFFMSKNSSVHLCDVKLYGQDSPEPTVLKVFGCVEGRIMVKVSFYRKNVGFYAI